MCEPFAGRLKDLIRERMKRDQKVPYFAVKNCIDQLVKLCSKLKDDDIQSEVFKLVEHSRALECDDTQEPPPLIDLK